MLHSLFSLWDKPKENARDRRRAYRYEPVNDMVFLGWWKENEFQTLKACLKDVSLGGASILLNTPPPEDPLVWISLYKVPPTDWVEATVVEAEKIAGSRLFSRSHWQIRIKFFENCSYDLFKASIEKTVAAPAP